MQTKKIKKIVLKTLEILVYISVGYFLYIKLGGNLEKIDLRDYNYLLIIISILIFATHNIFNGVTWNLLIKGLNNKAKLSEQMDVYLRSYILRYIPGNVVGIMARALFNRKYNIPMGQSLWGWFLENITYLGLAILIGSIAVLGGAISSTFLIVIMVITVIVGVLMFVKSDLLEEIFNKLIIKKLAKNYKDDLKDIKINMKTTTKINLLTRYFIAWVIYSISYLIVLSAVGIDPLENILLYVSINALSYAIGYLSIITPSGAGVREGVMVASLTELAGVAPEIAIVAALGARVVFILGELLGFLSFYLYKLVFNENGKV